MACLLQGVAGVLQGFLPIHLPGLGGAHQDSGEGCTYWWLHGPIHPKYFVWGCSLAILQAAPAWWRCPAEGNQGLPKHDDVWRYRLGNGNCPRNAAWQMTLRCFPKCTSRAHQGGIYWEAQEAIWHYCEKLPRRVPNHHQLDPYKLVTFAGRAHQLNRCTLSPPSTWWSWNLDSPPKMTCCKWAIVGFCHLCAHSNRIGGGWQLTGASLWVYKHGNHLDKGWLLMVFRPALIPYKFLIHAFRSEHLWSKSVWPSWTRHGLDEVGLSE